MGEFNPFKLMNDELQQQLVKQFRAITTIRPLINGDYTEVRTAMHADKHACIAPTHVVRKEDRIIGALSLGAYPTCLVWMHTKDAHMRDALDAMRFYENAVFSTNYRGIIVPCAKHSPLRPYLERVGYKNAGEFDLLFKEI